MGRRLAAQGIQLSRRTMVRAAVAGGAAAAGALLSGCGSSGSARPSRETVTQTAAAKATSAAFASWALGDWRVYHWFAGDEGPLGENTAMLAAKGVRTYTELADLLDDPAVAAAGGPGWDRVLGVAADSYTVGQSARDSDDLGWSGAWAMTPQGPQITLDLGSTTLDVLGPEYYNSLVVADGVDQAVSASATGSFAWQYSKDSPDQVTYVVQDDEVYLENGEYRFVARRGAPAA